MEFLLIKHSKGALFDSAAEESAAPSSKSEEEVPLTRRAVGKIGDLAMMDPRSTRSGMRPRTMMTFKFWFVGARIDRTGRF